MGSLRDVVVEKYAFYSSKNASPRGVIEDPVARIVEELSSVSLISGHGWVGGDVQDVYEIPGHSKIVVSVSGSRNEEDPLGFPSIEDLGIEVRYVKRDVGDPTDDIAEVRRLLLRGGFRRVSDNEEPRRVLKFPQIASGQ